MTPEMFYEFFSIEGTVVGAKTTSERVYSEKYSALANSSYLSSEREDTTSVWVVDSAGQERNLVFNGIIPVREGHHLKMIYVGKKSETNGYPIAAYNITAKNLVRHNTQKIRNMVPYSKDSTFGCLGIGLGLLAVAVGFVSINTSAMSNQTAKLLLLTGLIWTIALGFFNYSRASKINRQIEDLIQKNIFQAAGFQGEAPHGVSIKYTA